MTVRERELYNNAERFAKEYYELAKDGKVAGLTPNDKELLKKGRSEFIDFYSGAFKTNLENDYPEDSWDDKKAERLKNTKPAEGISYLLYGGDSPEKKHDNAEFTKFKEIIEDGKWHGMSPGAISHWASTKGGYDWSSKKSRDQFWSDLSKFDIMYNRGRQAQEFANSGWGKFSSIVSPSAYNEAMYQATTGDYDISRLLGQGAVDFAANAGTWLAPGAGSAAKMELAAPVLAGGAQAISEGARQVGKHLINGQLEMDPSAPITAFTLGSTIPMGATFIRSMAAQTPSQSGRAFARGMAKGTRGVMDAEQVEMNQIKADLLMARQGIKRRLDKTKEGLENYWSGGENVAAPTAGSLAQVSAEKQAEDRVLKQLRLLGTPGFENYTGGAVQYGDPIAMALQGFKDARTARGLKTPAAILPVEQMVDDAGKVHEGIEVTVADALKPEMYQRGIFGYDPILLSKVSKSAKLTKAEKEAVGEFQNRVARTIDNLKGEDRGNISLGITHNAETGKPNVGWIANGSPDWGYNNMGSMMGDKLGLLQSASEKMRISRGMDAVEGAYNSIGRVSDIDDPTMYQKALEMQESFPAKMSALGMDDNKKAYNLGLLTGKVASYGFGRIEPMTQLSTTSIFGNGLEGKANAFKNSEYFQNLPEQRKNVLEAAFKKVQEEEKQKKLDVKFNKQRVSRNTR